MEVISMREQQMPKKPIKIDNWFITYLCPRCKAKCYQFELFCDKCKQKLDWNE